jgi:hypothetical protein
MHDDFWRCFNFWENWNITAELQPNVRAAILFWSNSLTSSIVGCREVERGTRVMHILNG